MNSDFEARLLALKQELENTTVTEKRYKTSDPTVEKLAELFLENERGLLLERDELPGWWKTLERSGREGEREFYLEAWNGTSSYDVDRIARGSLHIPALTLSILGAVQPGKLERYISEALEGDEGADGLLQRFQLLVWPDGAGEWLNVDREPDKTTRQAVYDLFEKLDNLDPVALGAVAQEGHIPAFRFDAQAQELFDQWRDELERRLRSDELQITPAFESHLSKYRSLMPSLALLFHLVDVVETGEKKQVGLEAAKLAAKWCDFLEAHAKKIYAPEFLGDVQAARNLAEKIKTGEVKDGATLKSIYDKGWSLLGNKEALQNALAPLVERNWLRVEKRETDGRASEVLRLHPALRTA